VAGSEVAKASAIVDRDGRTWTQDELIALVSRAREDDPGALETLEMKFSASQGWWSVFVRAPAEQAEEALISASATTEFGRLAVRNILALTRNELAGPKPTPLVRLAARNAALCSLEADLAHRSSATWLAKNELPAEALQRWLDRADARFRKALKCLADLQRLQLPTVQVNVGGQQVNIATAQLNLPGSSGGPPIETAADAPGQVVVTGAAVPLPALASPTTATDAQMNTRSQGGREPADAATREPGEGLAAPSGTVGATLGTPDAFLSSECPTPKTSGTTVPAGVSPPRPSAPPSRPSPAARRRAPARRDRRGTDPRRAAPRGTNQPEHVKGAALMRDALPALIRGRRTAERRGRTRSPPAGGAGKRSR
jgi:hypothetical protein